MTNPNLLAYHVRGKRLVGRYQVAVVFEQGHAVEYPVLNPYKRIECPCDVCGREMSVTRFRGGTWRNYCPAHAPKRVGEGA